MSASPFSAEALARQVRLAMDAIPPGKKRALVGYVNTDGKWCVAYAERLNGTWKWEAEMDGDLHAGKVTGQVVIQGAW